MELLLLAVGAGLAALVVVGLFGARGLRRRDLRKKAQTRLQWGDLANAAKLFEESKDFTRAASLYREAGERLKAAQINVTLSDFDAAIEVLRGGRPDEIEAGAALLEKARALSDRGRAGTMATIASNAGLATLSASLFEKAGNSEEARASRLQEARTLAAQGKPLEAAAIYEKLGEVRPAAAAHAEAARREADPAKK